MKKLILTFVAIFAICSTLPFMQAFAKASSNSSEDIEMTQINHDQANQLLDLALDSSKPLTNFIRDNHLQHSATQSLLEAWRETSTVSTPNGSSVLVYVSSEELSSTDIQNLNNHFDNQYPEAIRLADASVIYNCHSYAWYKSSAVNPYWMPTPATYYSAQDLSYVEVSTSRVGDIICYYKSNGENIHSGLVVDTLNGAPNGVCGNSNLVMIESKWGSAGLYRHRGDQCPYPGLDATYVKYYRPRTGSSYTLNQSMSDKTLNKTINANGGIVDRYEMYELNVTVAGYYDFVVSSDAEPWVRLFENNYSDVSFPRVKFENHTKWFTKYFTVGTYYLRIEYMDETRSGNIITTMKTHSEHIYQCKPINDTHHIDKCECGVTQGAPSMHVIVIPTALLPPGLRSWCGYCGYLLPPNGNYPIITV